MEFSITLKNRKVSEEKLVSPQIGIKLDASTFKNIKEFYNKKIKWTKTIANSLLLTVDGEYCPRMGKFNLYSNTDKTNFINNDIHRIVDYFNINEDRIESYFEEELKDLHSKAAPMIKFTKALIKKLSDKDDIDEIMAEIISRRKAKNE